MGFGTITHDSAQAGSPAPGADGLSRQAWELSDTQAVAKVHRVIEDSRQEGEMLGLGLYTRLFQDNS